MTSAPGRRFRSSPRRRRREDCVTLVVLGSIALASWTWIAVMARDMYGSMLGASAWMMSTIWDWPRVLLLWAMWAAMMTAMMLPTATPLILLYAAAARRHAELRSPARRVYALAAGYVLVWSLFSVLATALQRILVGLDADAYDGARHAGGRRHRRGRRGGVSAHTVQAHLPPGVPIAARVHDAAWRGGAIGAFYLGVQHGTYCLGCCWALMHPVCRMIWRVS